MINVAHAAADRALDLRLFAGVLRHGGGQDSSARICSGILRDSCSKSRALLGYLISAISDPDSFWAK